jgi:hypothetical protein
MKLGDRLLYRFSPGSCLAEQVLLVLLFVLFENYGSGFHKHLAVVSQAYFGNHLPVSHSGPNPFFEPIAVLSFESKAELLLDSQLCAEVAICHPVSVTGVQAWPAEREWPGGFAAECACLDSWQQATVTVASS